MQPHRFNILLIVFIGFFTIDCATYWNNRRKDFLDIFTIGFEAPGIGAGVRVGPAAVGLTFLGGESAPGKLDKGTGVGLRGGRFGFYRSQQLTFFLLGGETFYADDVKYDSDGKHDTEKDIPVLQKDRDNLKSHKTRYLTLYHESLRSRKKKKMDAAKEALIQKFAEEIDDPALKMYLPKKDQKPYGYPKSYLFQIEVYVGVGLGIRLGFNFAELLDFIFGFTTIDILDDDLEE